MMFVSKCKSVTILACNGRVEATSKPETKAEGPSFCSLILTDFWISSKHLSHMKDDPQPTSPLSWIIKVEQKFLYVAFHSGLTHQQRACLFPVLMEIRRYKAFLLFHLRMTYDDLCLRRQKFGDVLGGYCMYWNVKNFWCGDCFLLFVKRCMWPGALESNYRGWAK